jgi:hypothetical protein
MGQVTATTKKGLRNPRGTRRPIYASLLYGFDGGLGALCAMDCA